MLPVFQNLVPPVLFPPPKNSSKQTNTNLHDVAGVGLVEEKKLLVGGEGPHVGGDDLLGGVAVLPNVDHGLEAEDAGELGLLVLGLGGVDGGDGGLEGGDGGLELRDGAALGVAAGGEDVLVDHIDHAEGLHLDGAGVVVVEGGLAGDALLAGHDAHLLEDGLVLVGGEGADGLNARVDAPHAVGGELLLVGLIVVVSVEDDLPVVGERLLGDVGGGGASLDGVGELLELLGGDHVEDGVDHGDVLGGTDGAELEAGSSVGEGGGAVAVLGGDGDGEDGGSSEVHLLDSGLVLAGLSVLEALHVGGHVISEVGGDDGGGGLAGSEAEVVSGRGDGHPHEVAVLVDGGDDGGHDHGEGVGVAGGGVELVGVKEVDAVGGADTPVVVLAGAVDIVEGLLLEEGGEAVLGCDLLNDLHDHDVLVDLRGVGAEEGCELVLVGGNFAVAGLEGDSHLPALSLHLLHGLEGGLGSGEGGHVVVAHLLSPGGVLAHDGAAGHLEVHAAEVLVAGDEEDLLLKSDVGDEGLGVVAHELEEPAALLVEGLVGAQEGSLLVKGGAIVRHKGGGDEDGVAAEEDVGGGVHGKVAAGGVGGTEASVREGGAVGLTADEVLALEVEGDLAGGPVELEHLVVDLAGQTVPDAGSGHGLEPVGVGVGSVVDAPVEDCGGDNVGAVLSPGGVVEEGSR
mmetsp:Transcript_23038/g.45947  ORF Transcript_23038/g.45947 Transcript_23038/m.45947 type:complete len:682 (+) Transcript_23038:130-2175(+)